MGFSSRGAMGARVLYAERFDESVQIAEQAMQFMRSQGIAPTPNSFTVWYAFLSGKHPDLTRAVEEMIANHRALDDESSNALFEQFFATDGQTSLGEEGDDRLQSALEGALDALRVAGADAGRYTDALANAHGQLSIAATLEQLRALVRMVAQETARMAASNRGLQDRLNRSADEVASMRRDLERIRREAMTDALIGLANRKCFDLTLREATSAGLNSDKPVCLLLGDIDHFKRFNDTHGHPAGDQVLKLVARTLTENVKGRDTAARYGGEEFAIILPDTKLEDAITLAEQIRKTVASRQIIKRTTGQSMGVITLSIGVAQYQPGEALTTFLQRADTALYAAKGSGRNRVCVEAAKIIPLMRAGE